MDALRSACCPCLGRRRRRGYDAIGSAPAPPTTAAAAAAAAPIDPSYPRAAASARGGGAAIGTAGSSAASTVSPTVPGVALPSWVADDDVEKCYGCATLFDLVHRRHHCRRCRNVFCGGCSDGEKPVLLLGFREPVRVCMRCSSECHKENLFIDQFLQPLLKGGEMTTSRGLLSRRVPVRVALSPALDRLEIREAATAKVTPTTPQPPALASIPLTDIGGVSEEGALSLLVLTASGGGRHRLECAGPAQRGLWVSALREAGRVLPSITGFRERVEAERQQRALQEQMALAEKAQREAALARRKERQGFRNQIAEKYGLPKR